MTAMRQAELRQNVPPGLPTTAAGRFSRNWAWAPSIKLYWQCCHPSFKAFALPVLCNSC